MSAYEERGGPESGNSQDRHQQSWHHDGTSGPDQPQGHGSRLEDFLQGLRKVKKEGGGWIACCPAHDDQHPSLGIDIGKDGRILLNCRSAGCSAESIVNALGLELKDLFADAGHRHSGPSKSRHKGTTRTFASIESVGNALRGPRAVGGTWVYHDQDGNEVLLVLRLDDQGGSKTFRQCRKVPEGWAPGSLKGTLPLYQLPRILEDETKRIYVVEGEKCVDALTELGLLATTSAGGARSAGKTDWAPLDGYSVTILPDNDDPGRKYAQNVASLLHAGAREVRILELPNLANAGDDVVDWIADLRAQGLDDASIAERLSSLEGTPYAHEPSTDGSPRKQVQNSPRYEPVLVTLADVEPQEVDWLWQNRIPVGRITLLVGAPGTGKSFLTCDLAARVSMGLSFPDGSPCVVGDIILLSGEDDPADTIRPRLDAHGANVDRVHILTGRRRTGDQDDRELSISLQDLDAIELALQKQPGTRLLVVDPIGSYLGRDVDAHRDNEIRSVLAPLAALAKEYGVALLVVAHRRKDSKGSADSAALGSVGIPGIARSVWHLSKAPGAPDKRLFLPGKQNLAAEPTGLSFRLVGEGTAARVTWDSEPVHMTADEALAAEQAQQPQPRGPKPVKEEQAREWLRNFRGGGAHPAKEVRDSAELAGFAARTIQRAAKTIGIRQERDQLGGSWTWYWPDGPGA